jgi:hypothetical protein
MACELLVTAKILESGLEDPEAANTACLVYLTQLHALPAVKEMFSVFLKGGLKSMFFKEYRLQSIKSVLRINNDLHNFASKFELSYTRHWPVINLEDRKFDPIKHVEEIYGKKTSAGNKKRYPSNGFLQDLHIPSSDMYVDEDNT